MNWPLPDAAKEVAVGVFVFALKPLAERDARVHVGDAVGVRIGEQRYDRDEDRRDGLRRVPALRRGLVYDVYIGVSWIVENRDAELADILSL